MSKGSDMSNRSNVVLIAEDDGELRELVCTELESEGFQVVSVTTRRTGYLDRPEERWVDDE